jgi:hypothetical protein
MNQLIVNVHPNATIFHKRRSKMDILRGGCVSIVDYLDLFWTLEERVKDRDKELMKGVCII